MEILHSVCLEVLQQIVLLDIPSFKLWLEGIVMVICLTPVKWKKTCFSNSYV